MMTYSAGRFRAALAVLCSFLLIPGGVLPASAQAPVQAESVDPEPAKIDDDRLDSLVAPIALYPDPLLSQVLVASTYPLELVECSQWIAQNPAKKGQELVDAAKKQDWDPSIQAMAAFPDLVSRLAKDIKWTTSLGNAFLAQQSDVMDAVQRMRRKAQDKGTLTSTDQQKVEVKTEDNKQVIIVQPASPEVIYVPTYNPTVVYPPPIYPYPPIYYPPPPPAGMWISFGLGVAVGAMFHGGWGWGCGWGWGHSSIVINNNYFVRNNFNNVNINNFNRPGRSNWSHNPTHRAGVPYNNRRLAEQYRGVARQDLGTARGRDAQSRIAQQGLQNRPNLGNNPGGNSGLARPNRNLGVSDRMGSPDRIGNRDLSRPNRSNGALGGAGSGPRTRMESNRGMSGMGSARTSGYRGGGGMRGGGRR